jgi:phosphate acyltransferase
MNQKNLKIGIDLLGGETPPETLLSNVIEWLRSKKGEASFLLFATEKLCASYEKLQEPHLSFCPVKELIRLDENPLTAIRKKKNSSLAIGIRLLKENKLHGFITSGNTGALVAAAKIELPMKNVERPALLALLPTKKDLVALIDVGANIAITANELKEFAFLGSGFQKFRGISLPRIGLLNIGSEAIKGTKALQEAHKMLEMCAKDKGFVFVGNIEANELFEGAVDVLVTEGFAGNVLLKTAEGFSSFVLDLLKTHPSFSKLQKELSYAEYGGAFLLGVNGLIIKCHSYSSAQAFLSAIQMAIEWSPKNLPCFLKNYLAAK